MDTMFSTGMACSNGTVEHSIPETALYSPMPRLRGLRAPQIFSGVS
jgi:hypothetical protein